MMKILLADDHVLFREGMRYVLQQLQAGVSEIVEAGNYNEALQIADKRPDLDLALLDINMPGSEGATSIRYFHQTYPHIPVVVISGEEDRRLMERVVSEGAMGFICKSSTSAVMLSALNLVLAGGVYVPHQILHAGAPLTPVAPPPREDDYNSDDKRVLTNEFGLTQRQMQVLRYLRAGMSNKEIAGAMNLAEGTIKIHVAALYQTLRVNNRMGAVRAADKLGLFAHNSSETYGQ